MSLGLLVGAACSGGSASEDTDGLPPPFSGSLLPAAPTVTTEPSGDPDPGSAPDPVAPAPASNEAPPTNVPIAPSAPEAEGAQAPAEETPAEETPAEETPPEMVPPEVTPTPETPPAAQTRVFLLFGQSNMWGVPLPQQEDLAINPRVEVLTTQACGRHGNNQWVPAQPPLHGCVGAPGNNGQGPGVGPGDYFAKTLADAFPEDTILLVPAAVPGASINTFQPGQQNYNNLLNRARMAQDRGQIAGMIFHQGESDSGQGDWPGRVRNVVDRLRADLGIGEVPLVAGELVYSPAGCCGNDHNGYVSELPGVISNTAIASAQGFAPLPASVDTFGDLHFDLSSQREFGRRYGQAMLDLLGE